MCAMVTYSGQRTTWWSWLLPSTFPWLPDIEVRLPAWGVHTRAAEPSCWAPKCGMYLCFRDTFVHRVKPYFSADCCYWSQLWDYNRRFLFSRWSHQTFTPLSFFLKKNCWTYRVNFIFEWCQLHNNWEMNKKECIQIISLIGWSLQSVKKLMGSFYVRTWDVASLEYF